MRIFGHHLGFCKSYPPNPGLRCQTGENKATSIAVQVFLLTVDLYLKSMIFRGVAGKMGQNRKTVLLVNDEEIVLNLGIHMLLKLGFDVLDAKDATEAFEICKHHQDKI